MEQLASQEIECFKDQLQDLLKPYQQEQNQRQKKADFLKQCIKCIEKNDFFQLDELLKSKQATDLIADADFNMCDAILYQLQKFAETQVDSYRINFKSSLLQLAQEAELPLVV